LNCSRGLPRTPMRSAGAPSTSRPSGPRACLVDQDGTGSRSQIRIEATSMVPWYMSSRLS
jgi:hypothetical protein